ncbi:MAG: hypothetical protein U0531_15640 [Dehalococcoidia bacterium]
MHLALVRAALDILRDGSARLGTAFGSGSGAALWPGWRRCWS